jgi:small redox-active disulfide protein 2
MGCAKCRLLEEHARAAVAELGLEAELVKVSEFQEIAAMGVMSTPALAIDGVVKSSGRVLSQDQIRALLAQA